MTTRFLNMTLRLLCCAMVLFPDFCLAGSRIPGNMAAVTSTQQAVRTTVQSRIPGLYNSRSLPVIPADEIPVLKDGGVIQGAAYDPNTDTSQNAQGGQDATINQPKSQAIIDWKTFNIGSKSSVTFNQQDVNSVVLNRIWDTDPSQIYGSLNAIGKVYLINQNGILFGPGSKVNVNTLVASALNITNKDFLNNILHFYVEKGDGATINDYYLDADGNHIPYAYSGMTYAADTAGSPNAVVTNQGGITAALGGRIFLIGPNVENFGVIRADSGQIGLASGNVIELTNDPTEGSQRVALVVDVKDVGAGQVWNKEGGQLLSDMGWIGMYGRIVNHDGLIRSITAVKNQYGNIELCASEKITTGKNSEIYSPVSDSPETADRSFMAGRDTFGGQVAFGGLPTVESNGIAYGPAPALIEHYGKIIAPAGYVTMNADQRVFLDADSVIDVGGLWSNEAASANVVSFQLSSQQMADYYGEKYGPLKGQTIYVTTMWGSSIGDLSQVFLGISKTALENATNGGKIALTANNGDIIVKQGSRLNISGGGINYAAGYVNTTKVLSGGRIYDIKDLPANARIDKILGEYTKTYERFGVTERFANYGLSARTYIPAHTKGGDAGTLSLVAGTVAFDGTLDGQATSGLFQTNWTDPGNAAALELSRARGLDAARSGTLIVGKDPDSQAETTDHIVNEIIVSRDVASLPADFGSDPSNNKLSDNVTRISANTLNAANLGTVTLYANSKITTEAGAEINLTPHGTFTAYSRIIELSGNVNTAAGTINLTAADNKTTFLANDPMKGTEKIIVSGLLDVAGKKIDNSATGKLDTTPGFSLQGGAVSIKDETDNGTGVALQSGAVVDVSGGYRIDQNGKVTGGSAGSLAIQGANILLDGDLKGYALADPGGKINGGQLTLASKEIHVYDHNSIMNPVAAAFYLADNRLDDTGFTQVTLNSYNDLIIEPNAKITTSLVRLNNPTPARMERMAGAVQTGAIAGSQVSGRPDLVRLDESMDFVAGTSSFNAGAGKSFDGSRSNATGNLLSADGLSEMVTVSDGSSVSTAPGGTISLSAPFVTVAGTLESPGGTIKVTASGNRSDPANPALLLTGNARILAQGYNRPDPATSLKGFDLNYVPVNGGSVALSAKSDAIVLDQGAIIDISGADAVENHMRSGFGKIISYQDAGDPGSLALTYSTGLTLNAGVNAKAKIAGRKGGILSISRTGSVLNVSDGVNDAGVVDIRRYLNAGFDDVTLKSGNDIQFSGSMNTSFGRKLTLDAQRVLGSGQDVTLQAPWIVVTNTAQDYTPPVAEPENGTGLFKLTGDWIDLTGSVQVGRFNEVRLQASRDIRVTDLPYGPTTKKYEGEFATYGHLVLQADRVYPTTLSAFTLKSYYDKVTILPSGQRVGGPIYSAGGNLNIEAAKGIYVYGTLAAPMGKITLTAAGDGTNPGRIYLADGSLITTKGNAEVNYGDIDDNDQWVTTMNKANASDTTSTPVDSDHLPERSVTLNADEVIVDKAHGAGGDGAVIDVSGGGSLFAYRWQAGLEGNVNPLTKSGRYIVISDPTFQLPGDSVYLAGGGGLKAGRYTLLDASKYPQYVQYAFLPGAYVIEAQSLHNIPTSTTLSKYGYPLVTGYSAVNGTSIVGTKPVVYSVRTAADVMTEGHFDTLSLNAGDGGTINLNGKTTIIEGTLRANAWSAAYKGGKLSFGASNIYVQSVVNNSLPAGFDPNKSLKEQNLDNLTGNLYLSADKLADKGFTEIDLGNQDPAKNLTNSITIEDNVQLQGIPVLALTAKKAVTDANNNEIDPSINLKSGARLGETANGQSTTEEIILATTGKLSIDPNAVVHARSNITLDVNDLDKISVNDLAKLKVDSSTITLKSSTIAFGGQKNSGDAGMYLTSAIWGRFGGYQNIALQSNDLQFRDNFNLSASKSITFDSARIVGANSNGTAVTVSAQTVNLKNSGAAYAGNNLDVGAASSGFSVNAADGITVGNGDVLVAGFKDVNLNSTNDLTFKGMGSLKTNGANLNVKAARVTTAADSSAKKAYIVPNFIVDAGPGLIKFIGSGATPDTTPAPGGTLEFSAKSIYNGTVDNDGNTVDRGVTVQVDGGNIKLVATGSDSTDGVYMSEGAQILARGTDDSPGGKVGLQADNAKIALYSGSLIDVSAGAQGDAGIISVSAPQGGVLINGDLKGQAKGGKGGSFVLHTNQLINANQVDDFANINAKLALGGFTESLDIRARTGNIDIASGQTVTAHHIKLTTDGTLDAAGNLAEGGQIDVNGIIDASANAAAGYTNGGTVELYSAGNLNVNAGGTVRGGTPSNPSSTDPSVLLSSTQRTITVANGGIINGGGGIVYLRALRSGVTDTGTDMNINLAAGSITGASAVDAEAFWIYKNQTSFGTWLTGSGGALANAGAYYNSANNTVAAKLAAAAGNGTAVYLLPGIEIDSTSDFTSSVLDLTSSVNGINTKYGSGANVPGRLTIRDVNNLNINANLVDHPTYVTPTFTTLTNQTPKASWGFNLVAGADTSSADFMAVNEGNGDLKIANTVVVYTENAPIRLASGLDTTIGSVPTSPLKYMTNNYITYNLASFGGTIKGRVGRDLIIDAGAIQTATGDIDIDIRRNLILKKEKLATSITDVWGAIRTTGAGPTLSNMFPDYANFSRGGNINLDVDGNVGLQNGSDWTIAMATSNSSPNEWDYQYSLNGYQWWSANFAKAGTIYATTGLATMGGGDLVVHTGGDFLTQAGTFGGAYCGISGGAYCQNTGGNLKIYAGGNIIGRFLNANGSAQINAMGSFGDPKVVPLVIELFNSQKSTVTALGNINVAAIVNPLVASTTSKYNDSAATQSWHIGYSENASVKLKAGGDVTLGDSTTLAINDPFYKNIYGNSIGSNDPIEILPPKVYMDAGGDIRIFADRLALLPAPDGTLSLVAKGSIYGNSTNNGAPKIYVSDMNPLDVYGLNAQSSIIEKLFDPQVHASSPVHAASPEHAADPDPIEVHAGQDIRNLNLYLPKKAEIIAERGDIRDIFYYGQNVQSTDVSMIRAEQGSIYFGVYAGANFEESGLQQAGPGTLFIQAGDSITLGKTNGIQTTGNGINSVLGEKGSDIVILAGYESYMTTSEAGAFFKALKDEINSGDSYDQSSLKARKDIIPMLGQASGKSGNIYMTTSQICTQSGADDIFVIAAGRMDVGKTAFISDADRQGTGIYTAKGGAINIFTGGDVNVNESRVMTFFGGDITIWSDNGNINAGRGASTAVNASPPSRKPIYATDANGNYLYDENNNQIISGYTVEFDPPAVGSGLRALTYDPDGPIGPKAAPDYGGIYPHAKVVDAGEAGIFGGRIVIQANLVVNAANISSSIGSVIGVPQAATTTGIGALSGAGTVATGSQLSSDAAGIAGTRAQASKMIDDIMTKWLDVKVIDFVQE